MSGMPVAEQPPVRRWLLPHERWFHWVESGGRRGRVNQRALSRQLRKYGPDGAVLIDAAMGNWVAASPFLIAAATITTTGHGTAILPWMWGSRFSFFRDRLCPVCSSEQCGRAIPCHRAASRAASGLTCPLGQLRD
jgi:hypothetical protein